MTTVAPGGVDTITQQLSGLKLVSKTIDETGHDLGNGKIFKSGQRNNTQFIDLTYQTSESKRKVCTRNNDGGSMVGCSSFDSCYVNYDGGDYSSHLGISSNSGYSTTVGQSDLGSISSSLSPETCSNSQSDSCDLDASPYCLPHEEEEGLTELDPSLVKDFLREISSTSHSQPSLKYNNAHCPIVPIRCGHTDSFDQSFLPPSQQGYTDYNPMIPTLAPPYVHPMLQQPINGLFDNYQLAAFPLVSTNRGGETFQAHLYQSPSPPMTATNQTAVCVAAPVANSGMQLSSSATFTASGLAATNVPVAMISQPNKKKRGRPKGTKPVRNGAPIEIRSEIEKDSCQEKLQEKKKFLVALKINERYMVDSEGRNRLHIMTQNMEVDGQRAFISTASGDNRTEAFLIAVDKLNRSYIFIAVETGYLPSVELALRTVPDLSIQGCPWNRKGQEGYYTSPIHLAIVQEKPCIFDGLLKFIIKKYRMKDRILNLKNSERMSPLQSCWIKINDVYASDIFLNNMFNLLEAGANPLISFGYNEAETKMDLLAAATFLRPANANKLLRFLIDWLKRPSPHCCRAIEDMKKPGGPGLAKILNIEYLIPEREDQRSCRLLDLVQDYDSQFCQSGTSSSNFSRELQQLGATNYVATVPTPDSFDNLPGISFLFAV